MKYKNPLKLINLTYLKLHELDGSHLFYVVFGFGNSLFMLCFCDFGSFKHLTKVESCSICLSLTNLFY